jgi:hypothetical protein
MEGVPAAYGRGLYILIWGEYDPQRHVGKKYEKVKRKMRKRKKEKKRKKGKKQKRKNKTICLPPVGVGVTNLINVSRGVQIRRDKDCFITRVATIILNYLYF